MSARSVRHPAVLAALLTTYCVAGKVGALIANVNPGATSVWVPAGIAIASFVIFGHRIWPAILGAAFLVNVTSAASIPSAIAIAIGNTLEGLTGALLLTRFAGGSGVFERPDRIFRFVVIVGLVSAPVSATVGVTSLALLGRIYRPEYGYQWTTWWLGHFTGDIVVVPFVMLWAMAERLRMRWVEALEFAGLLAALAFVACVAFGGWYPSDVKNYPFEFLCTPFLLWAALRFGRREVATAVLLLSGIAMWGTTRGFGSFARETPEESLCLLQMYMCVTAIVGMALAAVAAERKRAEEQLHHLAVTDPLTGLVNYRRLLEVLRSEIGRSDRSSRPFAVAFIDLDGLKRIDDRYGHLAGSRALVRVADAIRATCRLTDTPARFGGDEFAVVLTETDEAGAIEVIHRIAERLAADEEKPPVSVSAGLSIYPRDGATPATLLSAADAALYQARQDVTVRTPIEVR